MNPSNVTEPGAVHDIRLVRIYLHAPAKVWRALTTPALMARWGMRPEGFAPVVGNRFTLHGEPNPHWRGYIACEVTECREPLRISYVWVDNDGAAPTRVTYSLEPHEGGTRLTLEHSGFVGAERVAFAKSMMTPGWEGMLDKTFPPVLALASVEGAS